MSAADYDDLLLSGLDKEVLPKRGEAAAVWLQRLRGTSLTGFSPSRLWVFSHALRVATSIVNPCRQFVQDAQWVPKRGVDHSVLQLSEAAEAEREKDAKTAEVARERLYRVFREVGLVKTAGGVPKEVATSDIWW